MQEKREMNKMTQTKRGITAEDLYRIRYTSDPQLSPDGSKVVYVQTLIDEQRQYRSHLYVQSLEDNSVIALTTGAVRDTFPRWSPDGSTIAFVSNRSGKSQIWLIDAAGGEAVQLTHGKHAASQPFWSPDGRYILFSSYLDAGDSFLDREDKPDAAARKSIVVERMKYKSDEHGFVYGKNRQLALVEVKTGEIIPLTDGAYDHTAGAWSPDGKWLAIAANCCDNPDLEHTADLYLIPVQGGEWKKLTAGDGIYSLPTWSPDGRQLAYIGSIIDFHQYAVMKKIWVIDLETNERRCVTADWDVQVGDVTIGDVRSPGHPNPGAVWTADGKGFYFLASERGCSGIYHATLEGTVSPVVTGERNVYGFTYNSKTNRMVLAVSDPVTPGDLYQVDLPTNRETRLTEVNRELFADIQLSTPEEIRFAGAEGWEVHGWLLKPIQFQPGEKYPMILQIHGGPHSMYGNTFFHEFQLLAAKGYAVLYTNPRGSHGYGERFVQACCGDYGGNDYRDLMHAVDYACSRFDWIDETRLGVAGGSYGGFMTNWIIGQTNRFKAAVTDRSICNWISFYGVSDIGYYFSAEEIQANPFTNPQKMWEHSPLRLVANVETPLLIMHGERDYRCPIEQAEQLYIALKHQGKAPVSFVRFPDANHEMSRSGDPEQRVLRLQYTTDWFDTYLRQAHERVPSQL